MTSWAPKGRQDQCCCHSVWETGSPGRPESQTSIMGLGFRAVILGLRRDIGKENGNYYLGFRVYTGGVLNGLKPYTLRCG